MLVLVCAQALASTTTEITLTPATTSISSSVKIKRGIYTLGDDLGIGAIRVDSDGVTIDFQGATLQSQNAKTGRLETYNGIGLAINGHKNVTILNAHIHGFQYNIKAKQCTGLKLIDCELGQSRSQKIRSGDTTNAIWLDLRGLESWRGYGAGAWLENCTYSVVHGVRANQCQNGLILVKSSHNRVDGCDFSYNSGWGIALCRSSDNLICWNHADFVNRPWAGGWGGDSSGVALATQCNRNEWAFNSFTHSGDGFFLAALNGGFDDTDRLHEEGPCDGNWVVRNDGSWSTANAFESTFSIKNIFYKNIADDSNYGFWLGYSSKNIVDGNEICRSHIDGIAHEQGSQNNYVSNEIIDTGASAIHLWGGNDFKFRAAPSTDNLIARNKIDRAQVGIDLNNSTKVIAQDNELINAPVAPDFKQTKGQGVDTLRVPRIDEIMSLKPRGFRMYRGLDLPNGWQWLSATTYGMRDYRKMLAPWAMRDARSLRLYVRTKIVKHIYLPNWMTMTKDKKTANEWIVAPQPVSDPVGRYRPFRFKVLGQDGSVDWVQGQLLDLKWHVRWFKWIKNDRSAFQDPEVWSTLFAGPGIRDEERSDLPEIPSYRAPEPGLPADHFALVAKTKVSLDGGEYKFDTLSDDGIQLFVDGHMVINNWTHHAATPDTGTVTLPSGPHGIEVRYCQEDGAAALSIHWTRKG